MSKNTKEFIKFFWPLALTLIVVSTWFLQSRIQRHRDILAVQQATVVSQAASLIAHDMKSHFSDARFLARLVGRTFDGNNSDLNISELEKTLSDFAASRPFYFQVRFLGKNGQELLRIDRLQDSPVIIPPQALQNKAHRYYFQESMRGEKDDVYISDFDLNIEHGKLEIPHRPTLRFACPVISLAGEKLGVVVLNFDGTNLLERLKQQTEIGENSTLFCNSDGYWFLTPEAGRAWGHLLDRKDATMTHRFPQVWQAMSNQDSGQETTPQGLFSFASLSITPNSLVPLKAPLRDTTKNSWKIITWVAPAQLALPWTNLFILLTSLSMLVLAAGAWHLINYRVRQTLAEAQARESKERMLAITQSSQDAIIMVDANDRVTYWNPAARTMFGYEDEDVLSRELHTFLTHEPLVLSAARAAQGTEKVFELEMLHRDGRPIPVELSTSSFQITDQWYTVGSMRNISRRKRSEMARKRSEETARALLNAPTESALLIDLAGTIVSINEIGARRLEAEVKDLVGRSLLEQVGEEGAKQYREAIRTVLETGESMQFESVRRNRRFLINAYPVKEDDRAVENIAIFARDVTDQRRAETALRLSEQRFRDVSEAVGEYIWETNADNAFTFVTEDSIFVLGYTPDELLGRTMDSLVPESIVDDYRAWQADTIGNHQPFSNIEVQILTKDNQRIWLQISGVPYFDEEEQFMGYRGAAMNVTDRKEQQEAVKASERKLRALAESAYDAIVMINADGIISFWNEAAEALFGYSEDMALSKDIHDLVTPPEKRDEARAGLARFALTGKGPILDAVQEVEALHKDGKRIPVELSVSGFRLNSQWFAVATVRDITERKATEAKLRELATTDGLTNLNNRRRFMELAEREFTRTRRYARPLAMFMVDIDHFKNVNDTYGHDVGDEVLRSLSITATDALREADVLGRLGGEEFGILLPETSKEAAMDVAERLRLSVEQTSIPTSAGELNITVSIGVAIMDAESASVDALLKKADVALYKAKQTGRNRVEQG